MRDKSLFFGRWLFLLRKKQHIFMLQIFFRIQENSALASVLQQTHPSLKSLDFYEELLWVLNREQEAVQKGIEHFNFLSRLPSLPMYLLVA